MGRTFISWSGLCVVAGLALQPAHAGDRNLTASTHSQASTHRLIVAAPAKSSTDDHGERNMMKVQGRGELPISSVSPFESRLPRSGDKASTNDNDQKENGAPARHERKSITFFRFDSKFGNVSVQPVIGGVNGAQLSVGF